MGVPSRIEQPTSLPPRRPGAATKTIAHQFSAAAPAVPAVPAYLRDTYTWCYLNPWSVRLLDRPLVVWLILWGQSRKLQAEVLNEIRPGQRVLQMSSVYGDFLPELARKIGPWGFLDVIDVAPVQVERARKKLSGFAHVLVRHADAAKPGDGAYDMASSHFLLHEIPDAYKRAVVDAALDQLDEGGTAIFIDYHKPHWANPLKWIMGLVFRTLEPYTISLLHHEIEEFATRPELYTWRKQTYFGGLYQKVLVRRRGE